MKTKRLIAIILFTAIIALSISTSRVSGFQGAVNRIVAVAWSPDGTKIAIGGGPSCDPTDLSQFAISILDASSQQLLMSLQGHTCVVVSLAFSPDGSKLASSSVDKTLRVWDVASGQLLVTSEQSPLGRGDLAWSPDGTKIASVWLQDFRFEVLDATTLKSLKLFEASTFTMTGMAWSPDGTKLVGSGGADNSVRVWDYESGQLLRTLAGHTDEVLSVSWSPDGTKLASSADDQTLRIWDASSGQLLRTMQTYVGAISWNPQSTAIVGASRSVKDETAQVWDVRIGKQIASIQSLLGGVNNVAWSPDGSKLAYVGSRFDPQGNELEIVPAPPLWFISVPTADNISIAPIDETRFQAVAYDPAIGTNDGDGITQVEFEVHDSADKLIYSFTDTTPRYCAFGGDGPCLTAPPSITDAAPGTYTLRMRALLANGTYTDWVSRPYHVP